MTRNSTPNASTLVVVELEPVKEELSAWLRIYWSYAAQRGDKTQRDNALRLVQSELYQRGIR